MVIAREATLKCSPLRRGRRDAEPPATPASLRTAVGDDPSDGSFQTATEGDRVDDLVLNHATLLNKGGLCARATAANIERPRTNYMLLDIYLLMPGSLLTPNYLLNRV